MHAGGTNPGRATHLPPRRPVGPSRATPWSHCRPAAPALSG